MKRFSSSNWHFISARAEGGPAGGAGTWLVLLRHACQSSCTALRPGELGAVSPEAVSSEPGETLGGTCPGLPQASGRRGSWVQDSCSLEPEPTWPRATMEHLLNASFVLCTVERQGRRRGHAPEPLRDLLDWGVLRGQWALFPWPPAQELEKTAQPHPPRPPEPDG